MSDVEKKLVEENKLLRKKLLEAQKWMKKEVSSQKELLFQDTNIGNESVIEASIYQFFPPEILFHLPENTIDSIVSSEILFEYMKYHTEMDGMTVLFGYQKVLDSMIELYLTRNFRRYVMRNRISHIPTNNLLEKSLHSVCEKKYTLSLGRLFQVLSLIKEDNTYPGYTQTFYNFLLQESSLKKSLLDTNFFIHLEYLIQQDIIGEKRHKGILPYTTTIEARKRYIGDLHEKDCLIFLLIESQSIGV